MPDAPKVSLRDVVRAASKRLPIVGARTLNERLGWAADDMAEAYRIGAEEAQAEIVARLTRLAKETQDAR